MGAVVTALILIYGQASTFMDFMTGAMIVVLLWVMVIATIIERHE